MKKLVLVLGSAILLAVFIGFNYLLVERENREEKLRQLENSNASINSNVNALNRELKSLEDQNTSLEEELNQEKNQNLTLQSDIQQLKDEKTAALTEVTKRDVLVDALKKIINLTTFEDMLKKWAESIDTQKYEDAYKIEYGWLPADERKMTQQQYTAQYENIVKSLKFKSLQINSEMDTDVSGEVSLILELEVKLAENVDPTVTTLVDGVNKKLVVLKFISEKDGFVIENISDIK